MALAKHYSVISLAVLYLGTDRVQPTQIDKMQFEFRPGTGTTHVIFIARQLQERYRGKHRKLWWAIVDLEKAYDSAKESS